MKGSEILDRLKELDRSRGENIEAWMYEKRKSAPPYFYSSVDLRHSGQRVLPVDTNLFPAGFHNLSPAGHDRAARFMARMLEEQYPQAKRVALIPENHTRNQSYLENLSSLLELFAQTGVEVRLGNLVAKEKIELTAPSGKTLTQYPMSRNGDKLVLEGGFIPDVVVMNNDMTLGAPEILEGIEQPVTPPVGMGWWQRRKSVHFAAYRTLAEEFAALLSIDPWLVCAEFHGCGRIDFKERVGLDCIAEGVEKVLSRARQKHKQYGISEEPYVFIKADSGTYGMGIMTVRRPEEVLDLNKQDRNKMQTVKEGARVSEVIIQEGVRTIDQVDGKPAEPVIYLVDGLPVGGMYRVNGQRDAFDRLNATGMEFTGMCDEGEDECGRWKSVDNCYFRVFGLIAAIAALAAPRETY